MSKRVAFKRVSLFTAIIILLAVACSPAPAPATSVPPPAQQSSASSASAIPPAASSQSSASTGSSAPSTTSLVDASKKETGILMYSNLPPDSWKPILAEFNELYPWIKVEINELETGNLVERYLSEVSSNAKTADFLAFSYPMGWVTLANRKQIMPYDSPEGASLPDWSKPLPGVYTMSEDPLIMVRNIAMLKADQRPTGLASLAKLAAASPDVFKGKITTFAVDNPYAFSFFWALADKKGDAAWKLFETLGPQTKLETSSGTQLQKTAQGEYVVSYYIASAVIPYIPAMKLDKVLDWTFMDDGTPLVPRGIGIPQGSKNVNSAKLLLDYLLSVKGQTTSCAAGLAPYREGLPSSACPLTYQSMVAKVGKDNVLLADYDPKILDGQKAFIAKWNAAFGR